MCRAHACCRSSCCCCCLPPGHLHVRLFHYFAPHRLLNALAGINEATEAGVHAWRALGGAPQQRALAIWRLHQHDDLRTCASTCVARRHAIQSVRVPACHSMCVCLPCMCSSCSSQPTAHAGVLRCQHAIQCCFPPPCTHDRVSARVELVLLPRVDAAPPRAAVRRQRLVATARAERVRLRVHAQAAVQAQLAVSAAGCCCCCGCRSQRLLLDRTWCHWLSATAWPAMAAASRLSVGSSRRRSLRDTSSSQPLRRNSCTAAAAAAERAAQLLPLNEPRRRCINAAAACVHVVRAP